MAGAPLAYKLADLAGTIGKFYAFFDPVVGTAIMGTASAVKSVYDGGTPDPIKAFDNAKLLKDTFIQ